MSILKLDLSLNALFPKDPSNSQQAAHDAYFSDEPTTTELTEILTAATERSSKVASLAVFAWAIILQSMRDVVNAGMETTDIDLTLEESGERANLSSVSESGTSPGISYPSLESAQRKDAHSTQITQYASYSRCLDSVRQILPDRDIISELAASAVQVSRVYDEVSELAFEFCESHSVTTIGNYGLRMKVNLLKLISASLDYVEYLPEIIQACLICLQVRPESSDPTNPAEDLGLMMLHDPELRYKLLERARQRFPYELSPFLQLSTAVISVARDDSEILRSFIPSLSAARIFADRIPPEFTAYEMIDNGDDLGSVVLTEDLVILSPSSSSTRFSVPAQSKELKTSHREHLTALLIISSGSTGHVMSLAKPLMIAWNHDYSIFGYLGLLLQESTSNLDNDLATILEITTFIVTILKATISPPTVGPSETVIDPHSILEDFGDLIPGNTIALLLLQILDRCLESAAQEPTLVSQDMDDLISQCLQFCGILMELQPSTIWPLLADGFLFGSKLKPSGLLEVLVSRSTMMVDSSLVRCTVDLHQAMTRTVLGKLAPQKPSTCDSNRWVDRRGSLSRRKSCSTGLGNQVRSEVIFAATKMLIDLLTALGDFTRLDKLIVLRLEGQILEIFLQILTLTFGVGNGPDNPGPLQQSFGTSGRLLKKCYLAEEKVTHPANKLLDLIKRGHENVGFMTSNLADSQVDEALASGLKLSAFLVKLEKEQDNQVLNAKVGEALADLAALYTSSQMLRMPIARLIGNLYIWDDRNGNTPKSAFGMFAERDAADFVSLLSLFDQPRDDVDLRKSLWELFETLVGCQAQWFTTLLLKGSSASAEIRPSQGRRDQDQSCLRSVWSIAISKLLSGDCPIDEEVKILAFITSAVSERPWALRDLSKRTELKTALRKRLGHYLKELQEFRDTDQITALRHIHLIQACAQMFDLFAMDLHRSWQLGEKSGISALKSDFSEYHYDALSRTEYNPSLHANLKRNFESRFPGLSPRNFQRTSITQVELGQDFYYDTEVASRLLTFDPSWTAYNGFLDSFTRANLNFSAVQAQLVSPAQPDAHNTY